MSILLMSRVFSRPMGGSRRKLLLLRLADFADDTGRGIWPGSKRLAADTGLSWSMARRQISLMVDERLIAIWPLWDGDDLGQYQLDLERLFPELDGGQNGRAAG